LLQNNPFLGFARLIFERQTNEKPVEPGNFWNLISAFLFFLFFTNDTRENDNDFVKSHKDCTTSKFCCTITKSQNVGEAPSVHTLKHAIWMLRNSFWLLRNVIWWLRM
jgi:hypothetical protein